MNHEEATPLYTEQDLKAIRDQQARRWLVLLLPCLLLLAAVVTGVVIRAEWLATGGTLLIGVILIMGYDLFIRPIHRYAQLMQSALTGLTRQAKCTYQAITPGAELVDGVMMRTMTVTQLDDKDKPYERIFYYDVLKPFPALEAGQPLQVTYHDRVVVALEALSA